MPLPTFFDLTFYAISLPASASVSGVASESLDFSISYLPVIFMRTSWFSWFGPSKNLFQHCCGVHIQWYWIIDTDPEMHCSILDTELTKHRDLNFLRDKLLHSNSTYRSGSSPDVLRKQQLRPSTPNIKTIEITI